MPRVLFLSPLSSWRRHLVGAPALFSPCSARVRLPTHCCRTRPPLRSVAAVERKPCAQWSPPGPVSQSMSRSALSDIGAPPSSGVQREVRVSLGVVGYNGRRMHDKILFCPRDIKLCRYRRELEPGSIPVGTIVETRRHGPGVLPRRLLFYFCVPTPRVTLLVFLLVWGAIDG